MRLRVVGVAVDAQHDGHVGAAGGRADDHLAGPGGQVRPRLVAVAELAGRLQHHVDAELAPRQEGRVLLLEDLDLVPIDLERITAQLDAAGIGPVRGVVLEEERIHRRIGEVVDGNHLHPRRALDERPQ